jgi:hypothetical protein
MIVLLMSLACTDGGIGDEPCIDNSACDEGQACVAEECVAVDCLNSEACGIGQFCDPRNYVCRDGCEGDSDCLAGQECNSQTLECVDSACRSSELDCQVGQKCDEVTGQCFEVNGLCEQRCDGTVAGNGGCGGSQSCEIFIQNFEACKNNNDCSGAESCDEFYVSYCTTQSECPSGATCDTWLGLCSMAVCHEDFCMPTCSPNNPDSCAAGFQCLSDGAGSGVCYGECGYYKENGYL